MYTRALGDGVTGSAPPAYTQEVTNVITEGMAWGKPPPTASTTKTTTTTTKSGGGFWDWLGGALKGGVSAYATAAGQRSGQAAVMPTYQGPSAFERMAPWIAVGGAVVVVALILKKK